MKLLCTSYLEYKTNDWARTSLNFFFVGSQESLLATVERRKLRWFKHVTRHDSLSNTIQRGTYMGRPRHATVGTENAGWTK